MKVLLVDAEGEFSEFSIVGHPSRIVDDQDNDVMDFASHPYMQEPWVYPSLPAMTGHEIRVMRILNCFLVTPRAKLDETWVTTMNPETEEFAQEVRALDDAMWCLLGKRLVGVGK